ncbi:hypothetical protein IWQ60_002228 [Tieghemiomyces parasiticus]|uniref:Uncharacterized protein n=1 Tax=Tieghemiomyces parasiticus TaxID=78921 RepID=A0A9W8AHV1_9FUNG|nr:hypothetical protein IWQ60_002228 [Tieghemiomyces parasiticus]
MLKSLVVASVALLGLTSTVLASDQYSSPYGNYNGHPEGQNERGLGTAAIMAGAGVAAAKVSDEHKFRNSLAAAVASFAAVKAYKKYGAKPEQQQQQQQQQQQPHGQYLPQQQSFSGQQYMPYGQPFPQSQPFSGQHSLPNRMPDPMYQLQGEASSYAPNPQRPLGKRERVLNFFKKN